MDLLVIAKMEMVCNVFEHEQDAINSFFPERQVPRFDTLQFLEALRRKCETVQTAVKGQA
jgi:anti-sigma B factor antagonist